MEASVPYADQFFRDQRVGSRRSADAILPMLLEALKPRSIVDVGCGVGTWLAAAQERGVDDIVGIDGEWVDRRSLEIPIESFRQADLRRPLNLSRRFDLALCMEAAEHLPPERAATLVADLVALAPAILFSAAIPGQGGTDHVNEQWADFWADLFSVHGYRCVDAIRWTYWSDPRVVWWYAQNAFLYVAPGHLVDLAAPEGMPMRAVHPGVLTRSTRSAGCVAHICHTGHRMAPTSLLGMARVATKVVAKHDRVSPNPPTHANRRVGADPFRSRRAL